CSCDYHFGILWCELSFSSFFFQAEDGIRDRNVTGVQTCALPILIVAVSMYQMLAPYLGIHYFSSDQEVQEKTVSVITDADVTEGYLPSTPEQQLAVGKELLRESLMEEAQMSGSEIEELMRGLEGKNVEECVAYLEQQGIYGARYPFEDAEYHQGSAAEVNQ